MSGSLQTIAHFYDPLKAALVRNYVEAAGVRCYLSDEATVAMAWQYAQAVGGIKLQVASGDASQAMELVREAMEGVGDTKEALSDDVPPGSDEIHDDTADPEERPHSAREEDAERAFRAAIVGLLFMPLQLYVFWLLLKVFISDESLSARPRRHAWVAAIINVPFVFLMLWFVRLIATAE